jgi:hypothetical protein
MQHLDLESIKRRYKKARSKADLWISLLEACYHYTVPSRNLFYWTSQYQGAQKNARVWDSTSIAAVEQFVAKIQGGLCPPDQRWFLFEAGPSIPEQDKEEANKLLQRITDTVYFYLRNSNFDLIVNESLYDLAIGTGCLLCNPGSSKEEPLEFYSAPLARIAIEETACNRLKTVFRWWDEIRISDIKTMWPNAILPTEVAMLYAEDENATLKSLTEGTVHYPQNSPNRRYRYVVFYDNAIFLDQWLDDSSPWIIFRWGKVNNEIYGRGPVIQALPTILSLQEIYRIELSSANFNISKPYMAYSDGVFNPWTFKLEPNTVIPVSPNSSGQWPIQPFPDTANPAFMQMSSLDLRQQINKLLFADPLTPVQGPTRTATEMALRQRNLADQIGPAFTRLNQEFLSPILKRVVYLLQQQGLLEPFVINGHEIQISYKSPLAIQQGQKDIESFLQFYQVLQVVQGDAAPVNIDPVKFPQWLREKSGSDPTIIIPEAELEEFYKNKGEQQQELEMSLQQGIPQNEQQPIPTAAA